MRRSKRRNNEEEEKGENEEKIRNHNQNMKKSLCGKGASFLFALGFPVFGTNCAIFQSN